MEIKGKARFCVPRQGGEIVLETNVENGNVAESLLQEAFEDFKQYYDKRLKVAGTAGLQVEPVKKSAEEMKR